MMVWSRHDFERELKRQLIEIESIRKKVPQLKEIMERLDRLEESHLSLIRKLDECFQNLNRGGGGPREDDLAETEEITSEIVSEIDSQQASVDEGLLTEFHLLSAHDLGLTRRLLLEGAPSSAAEDGAPSEESSPQVVLVAEAVLNVPDLNERCATCGKVLISSLLAGEGITQKGTDWHHQACIEDDQNDRHSSILN